MKEKTIFIIGCGRLGSNMAICLSEAKHSVVIIDSREEAFSRISSTFSGMIMHGDATDQDFLIKASIKNTDSVIIGTESDSKNIMIAQMVRMISEKCNIIIRLYIPERKSVYEDMNINTICPSLLSINEIEKILDKE